MNSAKFIFGTYMQSRVGIPLTHERNGERRESVVELQSIWQKVHKTLLERQKDNFSP